MRREWRYFLLALGFFTRIPVAHLHDFEELELNHSAKYFPLVGLVVGLLGVLAYYLASLIFPHTIAVLFSMASTIYLTGAFHEDGLADSADGFGGGWHKAQVLTIMQDSRLGTYGVIALFFVLFGKFQVLNMLHPMAVVLSLMVAHALSRLSAVGIMAVLPYAKPEGKAKPLATEISTNGLLVAAVFGLMPYTVLNVALWLTGHTAQSILWFVLATALPVFLVWLWWYRTLWNRLGGYTGDTLGATQQLTELAFYFGVLAWSVHL